jgi:cardiolipin synthase (CMP-forming)
MPTYRARDLLLPANVLSLLRLPLAAVFPSASRAALAVLVAAAATDMLDGWLARRRGEATAVGAVVDPVADKVFALTVMTTLRRQGKLPGWGVAALLTREILEAPLVLWVFVSPEARRARRLEAQANIPGKIATVAQFGAVMAAVALPRAARRLLVLAAVAGAAAGASYWRRELRRRGAYRAGAGRERAAPAAHSSATR